MLALGGAVTTRGAARMPHRLRIEPLLTAPQHPIAAAAACARACRRRHHHTLGAIAGQLTPSSSMAAPGTAQPPETARSARELLPWLPDAHCHPQLDPANLVATLQLRTPRLAAMSVAHDVDWQGMAQLVALAGARVIPGFGIHPCEGLGRGVLAGVRSDGVACACGCAQLLRWLCMEGWLERIRTCTLQAHHQGSRRICQGSAGGAIVERRSRALTRCRPVANTPQHPAPHRLYATLRTLQGGLTCMAAPVAPALRSCWTAPVPSSSPWQ